MHKSDDPPIHVLRYFALDLFASIDNFNTETAATHSWKCQMPVNRTQAVIDYGAAQTPPWNLTAFLTWTLSLTTSRGFPSPMPHHTPWAVGRALSRACVHHKC